MAESRIFEKNNSIVHYISSATQEILYEYCILGFRWLIGFLITGSLINTQVLLDWLLEITLMDLILNKILFFLFDCFLHKHIDFVLFKTISIRMLSAWIIGVLLNESLLVILLSQAIYSLFSTYSQFFSKMIVESISVFYYFMNPWLLLPVALNLLLSFIYVLDMMFSTEMLFKLLKFPLIKSILNEWGINTHLQRKTSISEAERMQHQIQMTKYPGLRGEENLNFSILKQRYLPIYSLRFIEEQFSELKSFVAQQYYAHQSTIEFNGIQYFLPLEWVEFMTYRLRVMPFQQIEMFKKYLENDYHGAWRFLSNENPWMYDQPQNVILKKSLFELKNIEFIITIWLALKKEYQDRGSEQIVRTKIDMFIKILSRINRLGNQEYQLYQNLVSPDSEGDKMGNFSLLFPNLISLVSEKHPEEYISVNLVKNLLNSFAKSVWIGRFLKLDLEEMRYLHKSWTSVMDNSSSYAEYRHVFDSYNFSKVHRDDFILKMNILFGKNWLESENYLTVINNYFESRQDCQYSHPYLNRRVFSEAMLVIQQHLESEPISSMRLDVRG